MNSVISRFRFIMSMQNGPNDYQSMDNWLKWTGIGELINVVVFSLLLVWINYLLPNTISMASIVGLIVLNTILFQGGIYWIIKRRQYWNHLLARSRWMILFALYALNSIMFVIVPVVFLFQLIIAFPTNIADVIIGLLYYLFALAEYIHYYFVKINMRPSECERMLRSKRLIPARIMREFRKAGSELKIVSKT